MLFKISQSDPAFEMTIEATILVLLLNPVFVILIILYHGYWGESGERGAYKEKFDKSLFNTSIRAYFITFAYIFLPVFISYAAKVISSGSDNIFGILILVLTIINGFVIEYHILEL